MPTDPEKPPHPQPAAPPKAETARQEGAQGKPPGTGKADDGNIDASDPKMTAVKY